MAKCGVDSVEINAYLNAKTNTKKLQYGENKCVKLHLGKDKEHCPDLKINTWRVKCVESHSSSEYEMSDEVGDIYQLKSENSQKYLGDILSSDTKNAKNIQERKNKGLAIICQIKNILDEGFFGAHHFKAAVLLRDSLFLNSILLNSEVWINVTNSDMRELTLIDNILMRTIWNCPRYNSLPMMFLDLGCIPLKVVVMKRRVMFLHYILQQPDESLLYKTFDAQYNDRLKGDWICQTECDLSELNITLS